MFRKEDLENIPKIKTQIDVKGNSKGNLQGNLCDICTGCGRCFHQEKKMHIVTTEIKIEKEIEIGKKIEEVSKQNQNNICQSNTCDKKQKWLIAVDIGTTTIAMVLFDKRGKELHQFAAVNPQTQYGADVLSRIQAAEQPYIACIMQSSVQNILIEGVEQFLQFLQDQIKESLQNSQKEEEERKEGVTKEEIKEAIKRERKEEVTKEEIKQKINIIIAANTTMIYLLMGWKPKELGQAPFHASHLDGISTEIAGISTTILPGLSAFVGADILAGIYACDIMEQEEPILLIDLGTNGEMVLGNAQRMVACSTAAGPAFEGGVTKGVWGADIVKLTARLLEEGILDENGLLAEEYFEKGIRIGNVVVTQQAIRSLQLAKGAIAAGIRILIKEYGLDREEEISKVILAGGFGYFLDAKDAAKIGLLPKSLAPKTQAGGNTAITGILRFAFCKEKDLIAKTIQNKVKVLNLAEFSGFEKEYLDAMYLRER